MAFIGIDPGAKGGVALLSAFGRTLNLAATPTVGGKFNVSLFISHLRGLEQQASLQKEAIDLVIIEAVSAMPGQGVTSMFSFGYCAGAIEAAVSSFRWPYQLIRPMAWQKDLHIGIPQKMEAKAKSLIAAQRLFPKETFLATSRSTKPHDGIIDAVLLAEYGRRIWGGALAKPDNHLAVLNEW